MHRAAYMRSHRAARLSAWRLPGSEAVPWTPVSDCTTSAVETATCQHGERTDTSEPLRTRKRGRLSSSAMPPATSEGRVARYQSRMWRRLSFAVSAAPADAKRPRDTPPLIRSLCVHVSSALVVRILDASRHQHLDGDGHPGRVLSTVKAWLSPQPCVRTTELWTAAPRARLQAALTLRGAILP